MEILIINGGVTKNSKICTDSNTSRIMIIIFTFTNLPWYWGVMLLVGFLFDIILTRFILNIQKTLTRKRILDKLREAGHEI